MSTLNSSLQKLRKLAPELNRTADEAAKIVGEVEALLNSLSIGIAAEVAVSSATRSKTTREFTSLAYRRMKSNFRIAVLIEKQTEFANSEGVPDAALETVAETPWAECPRDLKLESFPRLPDLLHEIIKRAEETSRKVQDVQQTLKDIIGSTPEKPTDTKQLILSTLGEATERIVRDKFKASMADTSNCSDKQGALPGRGELGCSRKGIVPEGGKLSAALPADKPKRVGRLS